MFVYAWATTDVGRKRHHNEDRYLIAREARLFAVADGMGGQNAGEVAASIAVRVLDGDVHARVHDAVTVDGAAAVLRDAVKHANAAIHAEGRADVDKRGMGTTTTSLLFVGDHALLAHVGDSRCYRVRHGAITQLTNDHSLVEQQVRAGLITRVQAQSSPFRNVITRAVGAAADVDVDVDVIDVKDGDAFVLCSDGLSGVVSDDEIAAVFAREPFLHRVPDALIDLANERGGPDNVTVIVCYSVARFE